MSKRKHKSRRDTKRELNNNNSNTNSTNNAANMNNRQAYNNGPFGINPNALLSSMFGNIDMNQINSLLQSMNTQGFDFNNLNLGNLQNLMGGMGSNQTQRNPNVQEQHINSEKLDDNNTDNSDDLIEESDVIDRNDDNIEMLRAIRSIVGGERRNFIDRVIKLYNDGKLD